MPMTKRLLLTLCLALFGAITAFAQTDVTTFLGIPVDGTRLAMRQKLINKGFTPVRFEGEEHFEGEFNGADVNVYIVTNNNKVYRLMIADRNMRSEAQIKIRFNKLVDQFEKNGRYAHFSDQRIPSDENIKYGMLVHNKQYEASFYQAPTSEDEMIAATTDFALQLAEEMQQKYSDELLANPTEEIQEEINSRMLEFASDYLSMKSVWFTISEFEGEYYICMYYDNKYNEADGEDL